MPVQQWEEMFLMSKYYKLSTVHHNWRMGVVVILLLGNVGRKRDTEAEGGE